jgi:hypothetical protein
MKPISITQAPQTSQTSHVDGAVGSNPNQQKQESSSVQSLSPRRSMAASSNQSVAVKDTLSGSKNMTVENGGKKLTINLVSLGDRSLGALDKFNIYSWRSLGHEVNLHTHPFTAEPHTLQSLGLEPGDVNLMQLKDTLEADEQVVDTANSKTKMPDTRKLLNAWLGAIPKQGGPSKEHIFNMVDATKSYLGGTQHGLTMDMKVGPSPHLQEYSDSFSKHLVSYTRGGNTAGVPENQLIGTMQESNELRSVYADKFDAKIKGFTSEGAPDHDDAWFNTITGYHGRSYQQSKNWIDVATKTPTKDEIGDKYPVNEPGNIGHGPFRVYKHASDQSNKNAPLTKPEDVHALSQGTLKELKEVGADEHYYNKAAQASDNLKPR